MTSSSEQPPNKQQQPKELITTQSPSVRITRNTYEALLCLKIGDMTFDDVIADLVEFFQRNGSQTSEQDVKELFRKEIAKWKDEDPLFMAYVHGQEAGRIEGARQARYELLDKLKEHTKKYRAYRKDGSIEWSSMINPNDLDAFIESLRSITTPQSEQEQPR